MDEDQGIYGLDGIIDVNVKVIQNHQSLMEVDDAWDDDCDG